MYEGILEMWRSYFFKARLETTKMSCFLHRAVVERFSLKALRKDVFWLESEAKIFNSQQLEAVWLRERSIQLDTQV